MSAPERIWVDIADEYTRGAMIGNVYATDIGDEPYIHLDLHEAAVAAARAEGMLAGLLRAAELPAYDGDGDPSGTFDHKVFVKIDAIRAEAALTKIARIGQEWEASK